MATAPRPGLLSSMPLRVGLGALIVVAGIVWGRAMAPASQAGDAASSAAAVAVDAAAESSTTSISGTGATSVAGADAQLSTRREEQRRYAQSLAWARDPFTRAAGSIGGSGLTLSGILWDPRQPMAILNGQPASVGQQVDGWRVVEIHQDRVVINDGAQTLQLTTAP
jgi:hypothetical protein